MRSSPWSFSINRPASAVWTTWFSLISLNSLSGGLKWRPRPKASYALEKPPTHRRRHAKIYLAEKLLGKKRKLGIYRTAWRWGWRWAATFSANCFKCWKSVCKNVLSRKIGMDTTQSRSSGRRRRGTLVEGHSRCPLVVEARALAQMASVAQLSAWLGVHFAYAPPVAPLSNAATPLSRLSPLQPLGYAVRQPSFPPRLFPFFHLFTGNLGCWTGSE